MKTTSAWKWLIVLVLGPGLIARADDSSGAPLHLEYAVVVPHGNAISCYGVPVGTGDGVKNYDIELSLSVDASGNLHADTAKMTPSPVLADNAHHFLPGDYVKVNNPQETVTISGPVLGPDGREIWSMKGKIVGTWMNGPAQGNNLLRTFPADSVYPKGYCFGLDNSGNLLAVQQLGDKIVIARPAPAGGSPSGWVIQGSDMYELKPPSSSN